MISCVYCDNPLECDACREPYRPPGQAEYDALSRPEIPVICHDCGAILVCHWCRTPYDGQGDSAED